MDNSTGYQCQRCDKVFGPWDYGWPPDCCAVKESIHLHLIEPVAPAPPAEPEEDVIDRFIAWVVPL